MIKLGIVMDPIANINIKKDSSFAMLLEAQRRGYELHYMEMNDLYLINGEAAHAPASLTSSKITTNGTNSAASRILRSPISMSS